MSIRITKPDGFMPDGTPVCIACARTNGKTMLQLEIYRKLCGISDEEWTDMKHEVMKRLGYSNDEEND